MSSPGPDLEADGPLSLRVTPVQITARVTVNGSLYVPTTPNDFLEDGSIASVVTPGGGRSRCTKPKRVAHYLKAVGRKYQLLLEEELAGGLARLEAELREENNPPDGGPTEVEAITSVLTFEITERR
jgi:hypothetical protein